MNGRETFDHEIKLFRQQHGEESADRLCTVLAKVAQWLRIQGHGDVTLSAIEHRFAKKFRVASVVTVDGR